MFALMETNSLTNLADVHVLVANPVCNPFDRA